MAESKRVLNIGFLKTLCNGITPFKTIKQNINGQETEIFEYNNEKVPENFDQYCPTYNELKNGRYFNVFTSGATKSACSDGLCLLSTSYRGDQLVKYDDVSVRHTSYSSITLTANPTSVSHCGDSKSTLTKSVNFGIYEQKITGFTTSNTASVSSEESIKVIYDTTLGSYSNSCASDISTIDGNTLKFTKNASTSSTRTCTVSATCDSYTEDVSTVTVTQKKLIWVYSSHTATLKPHTSTSVTVYEDKTLIDLAPSLSCVSTVYENDNCNPLSRTSLTTTSYTNVNYTKPNNCDWITINGKQITVAMLPQGSTSRTCNITCTFKFTPLGSGATEQTSSVTLTISQTLKPCSSVTNTTNIAVTGFNMAATTASKTNFNITSGTLVYTETRVNNDTCTWNPSYTSSVTYYTDSGYANSIGSSLTNYCVTSDTTIYVHVGYIINKSEVYSSRTSGKMLMDTPKYQITKFTISPSEVCPGILPTVSFKGQETRCGQVISSTTTPDSITYTDKNSNIITNTVSSTSDATYTVTVAYHDIKSSKTFTTKGLSFTSTPSSYEIKITSAQTPITTSAPNLKVSGVTKYKDDQGCNSTSAVTNSNITNYAVVYDVNSTFTSATESIPTYTACTPSSRTLYVKVTWNGVSASTSVTQITTNNNPASVTNTSVTWSNNGTITCGSKPNASATFNFTGSTCTGQSYTTSVSQDSVTYYLNGNEIEANALTSTFYSPTSRTIVAKASKDFNGTTYTSQTNITQTACDNNVTSTSYTLTNVSVSTSSTCSAPTVSGKYNTIYHYANGTNITASTNDLTSSHIKFYSDAAMTTQFTAWTTTLEDKTLYWKITHPSDNSVIQTGTTQFKKCSSTCVYEGIRIIDFEVVGGNCGQTWSIPNGKVIKYGHQSITNDPCSIEVTGASRTYSLSINNVLSTANTISTIKSTVEQCFTTPTSRTIEIKTTATYDGYTTSASTRFEQESCKPQYEIDVIMPTSFIETNITYRAFGDIKECGRIKSSVSLTERLVSGRPGNNEYFVQWNRIPIFEEIGTNPTAWWSSKPTCPSSSELRLCQITLYYRAFWLSGSTIIAQKTGSTIQYPQRFTIGAAVQNADIIVGRTYRSNSITNYLNTNCVVHVCDAPGASTNQSPTEILGFYTNSSLTSTLSSTWTPSIGSLGNPDKRYVLVRFGCEGNMAEQWVELTSTTELIPIVKTYTISSLSIPSSITSSSINTVVGDGIIDKNGVQTHVYLREGQNLIVRYSTSVVTTSSPTTPPIYTSCTISTNRTLKYTAYWIDGDDTLATKSGTIKQYAQYNGKVSVSESNYTFTDLNDKPITVSITSCTNQPCLRVYTSKTSINGPWALGVDSDGISPNVPECFGSSNASTGQGTYILKFDNEANHQSRYFAFVISATTLNNNVSDWIYDTISVYYNYTPKMSIRVETTTDYSAGVSGLYVGDMTFNNGTYTFGSSEYQANVSTLEGIAYKIKVIFNTPSNTLDYDKVIKNVMVASEYVNGINSWTPMTKESATATRAVYKWTSGSKFVKFTLTPNQ